MNYYAESFAEEAKAALAQSALVGLGENRVAFVSRVDLAAAAAGLFAGEEHEGAVYTGTGPRTWTDAERADLVARLTGKALSHVAVPVEDLRARFLAAGLPPHVVEVVLPYVRVSSRGDLTSSRAISKIFRGGRRNHLKWS